jgi:hypothetical protein
MDDEELSSRPMAFTVSAELEGALAPIVLKDLLGEMPPNFFEKD